MYSKTITGVFMKQRLILFICCLTAYCCNSAEENTTSPLFKEISNKVPPLYFKDIAPLTTSLDDVLKVPEPQITEEDDVAVLLAERILFYDKGKIYRLYHRIEKALTKKGCEDIKEDKFSFSLVSDKIFFIKGGTYTKEGGFIPVTKDSLVFKTPQHDSKSSLYSDDGEMTIIFPRVEIGSIVESYVLKEHTPAMDGHFANTFYLDLYDPVCLARNILEAPKKVIDDLIIDHVGSGVPKPREEKGKDGRARLIWEKQSIKALDWGPGKPYRSMIGPVAQVTTTSSWDDMAHWYLEQLSPESFISDTLKKEIDDWTANTENPNEIAQILLDKMNEVRYTGLEFGNRGYVPRNCNDIWEKRFGDCKEKANLLRVMLKYKGINAYIALLKTKSIGKINKNVPRLGAFNHAILAIEFEKGNYTFCDPTIEYLKVGNVGRTDSDREVLIVRKKPEFVYIPSQHMGNIDVQMKFTCSSNGGLSGWYKSKTDNVWGAYDIEKFWRDDEMDREDEVRDDIQAYFKGAKLIDYKATTLNKWDHCFEVNAYCEVDGNGANDLQHFTLTLPDRGYITRRLDSETRKYPLTVFHDNRSIEIRYTVPKGWGVKKLPDDFSASGEGFGIDGSWKKDGEEYIAKISSYNHLRRLPQKSYKKFYHMNQSAIAWLGQSIIVEKGTQTQTQEHTSDTTDFPMLLTGKGQLELVNSRFPYKGSISKRRNALKQVIQWFPKDPYAVYIANIQLCRQDMKEEKWDSAAASAKRALDLYANKMTPNDKNWGEYIHALAYREIDKTKAESLFLSIAQNKESIAYWRNISYNKAATINEKDAPKRALDILIESMEVNDGSNFKYNAFFLALLAVESGEWEMVKPFIERMKDYDVEYRKLMYKHFVDCMPSYFTRGESENWKPLLELLSEQILSDEAMKELYQDLKVVEVKLNDMKKYALIYNELKQYLKKTPPAWYSEIEIEKEFKPTAEGTENLKEFLNTASKHSFVKHVLHTIISHPIDPGFLAENLWQVSNQLNKAEDEGEDQDTFFLFISELLNKLPKDNQFYFEGKFEVADAFENSGDLEGALNIYLELLELEHPTRKYSMVVTRCAAQLYSAIGADDKSLEFYKKLEEYADISDSVYDYITSAVYLNIRNGNYPEAFRLIELFKGLDEKVHKQHDYKPNINALLPLINNKKQIASYWDNAHSRWQSWCTLKNEITGQNNEHSNIPLPVLGDLTDVANKYSQAVIDKKVNLALELGDKLAAFAYYHPNKLLAIYATLSTIKNLDIKHKKVVENHYIKTLESLKFDDEGLKINRAVDLIAAYHQAGDTKQASKYCKEYEDRYPRNIDDQYYQGFVRLNAVCALAGGRDIAHAIDLEETLLREAKSTLNRPLHTYLLVQLLLKENRKNDAVKVISGLLDDITINKESDICKLLKEAHKKLVSESKTGEIIQQTLERWTELTKLDWLQKISVPKIEKKATHSLKKLLGGYNEGLTNMQYMRIMQYITNSNEFAIESRWHAFRWLLYMYDTYTVEWNKRFESRMMVIETENIDPFTRQNSLSNLITDAFKNCTKSTLSELLKHPLVSDFTGSYKEEVDVINILSAYDLESAGGIYQALETLLTDKATNASIIKTRDLWSRLEGLNALNELIETEDLIKNSEIPIELEVTKNSLRLELKKRSNNLKRKAKQVTALKKIISEYFPENETKVNSSLCAFKSDHSLFFRESITTSRVRSIHELMTVSSNYDPLHLMNSIVFCTQYGGEGEKAEKLRKELTKTLLREAKSDQDLSGLLGVLYYWVNFRDEGNYLFYSKLFENFDNKNYPLTQEWIRSIDFKKSAMNNQDLTELASSFSTSNPFLRKKNRKLTLSDHINKQNTTQVSELLDLMNESELTDLENAQLVSQAYKLTNRVDELDLVKEMVEERLNTQIIPQARLQPGYMLPYILYAMFHLDIKIDSDWLNEQIAQVDNKLLKLEAHCAFSLQNQDWLTLSEVSRKLKSKSPDDFSYNWYNGLAEYHLENWIVAEKQLNTFIKNAPYSLNCSKAKELLHKISLTQKTIAIK